MGLKDHVHGDDGWYAYRPPLKGCRCGSCEDENPELRTLICDSVIPCPCREPDDFPHAEDCEHEISPTDVDNFDELWQNARF